MERRSKCGTSTTIQHWLGRSNSCRNDTQIGFVRRLVITRMLLGQIGQQWSGFGAKQRSITKQGDKRGHKKDIYPARNAQHSFEDNSCSELFKHYRQPIKRIDSKFPQGVSTDAAKILGRTSQRASTANRDISKAIVAFPVTRANPIPDTLRRERTRGGTNPQNRPATGLTSTHRPSEVLRPKCRAEDRLFLWKGVNTPPPATINNPAIKLLAELASHASLRDPQSYGSAIRKFHVFCDIFSIPETQRLPASFQLMHSFALWVVTDPDELHLEALDDVKFEPVSVKTARKYLSGVRAWHIAQGWPPPLSKDDYSRIDWSLRGMQNMFGSRTKPMRPPMTIPMLHALKNSLDMNDPFDACIWAMVTCAFWGMMRFGEVSVSSRLAFDGRKHLKQSDVVMGFDTDGREYDRLDLPAAKTAKTGEIQSVFIVPQNNLCPIQALKNMARVTPAGRSDPLFSWQDRQGAVRPMVRDKALGRINQILQAWGWGTTFGHSLRIGGASFYLAEGKDPELIRIAGRWRSLAYQVGPKNAAIVPGMNIDETLHRFTLDRLSS